jgi:sec-independent protein translocase protein TatB
MIDIGISKIALIGAVALVVIGPERLPKVARIVGTFLGKAQRYVADVKAEVNRTMELEELQKMKASVESAARDVQESVQTTTADFEKDWADATSGADNAWSSTPLASPSSSSPYKPPRKNWRIKQGATPLWYKSRHGIRTKALSGAARVARYRPRPLA